MVSTQLLNEELWFPDPLKAPDNGFLAVGGDLSVARLKLAYHSGVFPWYEKGQPILWWSPNPRMVMFPHKFKVSKSLKRTIKKKIFRITFNESFEEVIAYCARIPRKGQGGTWITDAMLKAYLEMHNSGYATSIEIWQGEKLVGGLYGIDLPEKGVFCGESMFSLVSDASKVAFYTLSEYAKSNNYKLIDCQIYNSHLESLGAEEIDRASFLKILNQEF